MQTLSYERVLLSSNNNIRAVIIVCECDEDVIRIAAVHATVEKLLSKYFSM